jgi:alanyl-tRNA synthetase
MVTPDLVGKGIHAGDIVQQVARVTGGGGGGKAEMAQAGGKDRNKIDEALRLVPEVVRKRK